jgi:hypothetical protein
MYNAGVVQAVNSKVVGLAPGMYTLYGRVLPYLIISIDYLNICLGWGANLGSFGFYLFLITSLLEVGRARS